MVCAYGGQAGGGFHNDAACRGATKIVRPPLMSGMRGLHGVRICLGCGRAGESSRCEDPAPTVGVGGDAFAWRVRSECRYYHRLPPHAMPPREPHVIKNHATTEGRALEVRRRAGGWEGGRVEGRGWWTVNQAGGGIFALRRPRPYSRAFAGMPLRGALRSECRYYHRLPPHAMPPREPHVFHNDAAREGRALAGGRVCGHGSVCKPNPVGLRIAGGKAAECDLDAAR